MFFKNRKLQEMVRKNRKTPRYRQFWCKLRLTKLTPLGLTLLTTVAQPACALTHASIPPRVGPWSYDTNWGFTAPSRLLTEAAALNQIRIWYTGDGYKVCRIWVLRHMLFKGKNFFLGVESGGEANDPVAIRYTADNDLRPCTHKEKTVIEVHRDRRVYCPKGYHRNNETRLCDPSSVRKYHSGRHTTRW